jgi:hypothetical protein
VVARLDYEERNEETESIISQTGYNEEKTDQEKLGENMLKS